MDSKRTFSGAMCALCVAKLVAIGFMSQTLNPLWFFSEVTGVGSPWCDGAGLCELS